MEDEGRRVIDKICDVEPRGSCTGGVSEELLVTNQLMFNVLSSEEGRGVL